MGQIKTPMPATTRCMFRNLERLQYSASYGVAQSFNYMHSGNKSQNVWAIILRNGVLRRPPAKQSVINFK
eukprot:3004802-Pyramimonas_sp.AAC.1